MRSTNEIKASNSKPFWCRWDFRIFNLGKSHKNLKGSFWKTSPGTNQHLRGWGLEEKEPKKLRSQYKKLRILSCLYLWHASLKRKTQRYKLLPPGWLTWLKVQKDPKHFILPQQHPGNFRHPTGFFPNFQLPEKPHDEVLVTLDHFDWTPLRILA